MSAADQAIETLLHDGEPAWGAIDFEIACPRCGYNLRLLTRPRCPECGLDFEWRAVLDRAAWRSDFLFEHHWRTRPVRSWLETVWRSIRPFRFWRSVSIHDRIEVGPLLFMMLGSVLVFMTVLHATAWLLAEGFAALDPVRPFAAGPIWNPQSNVYGRLSTALEGLAGLPFEAGWYYLPTPGAALLTLFAALALLSSLRQTLGRCRVRPRQMVRVAAYMSTPVAIHLAFIILGIFVFGELFQHDDVSATAIVIVVALLVIPPLVLGVYLSSGLWCYLKLPRPFLLGVMAAGVAILFTMTTFAVGSLVARGELW